MELEVWQESKSIGRKRKWFSVKDALTVLALHRPLQCAYLEGLSSG